MPRFSFPAAAGVDLPGAGDDDQAWEPIAARLRALGLPAERLSIRREGERVTIAGPVPDPAVQERIVAAAGNLRGIATVVDNMHPAEQPGLLSAFAGLAHLPPGAASLDAAQARVHDAAPDQGDTAFGPAGSLFHTVQEGETLAGIAQRHYGMTAEAPRLVEANPGLPITAPGPLPTGLVLRLPLDRRLTRRHGPAAGL